MLSIPDAPYLCALKMFGTLSLNKNKCGFYVSVLVQHFLNLIDIRYQRPIYYDCEHTAAGVAHTPTDTLFKPLWGGWGGAAAGRRRRCLRTRQPLDLEHRRQLNAVRSHTHLPMYVIEEANPGNARTLVHQYRPLWIRVEFLVDPATDHGDLFRPTAARIDKLRIRVRGTCNHCLVGIAFESEVKVLTNH